MRKPEDFTCPSLAVVASASGPVTVVWRPILDRGNHATEVIGFVTDADFVAKVFEKVVKHHALLPPTLVPSGSPNGALAVRVTAPAGQQLFASSNDWSNYAASTTLPPAYGRLELAVALRPAEAGGLVIGGLPRERLPLLAGLLTLTAGLVVVALVQLRREAGMSRLRADFISGVSHELRTPLAQIRMFAETLLLGRVRSRVGRAPVARNHRPRVAAAGAAGGERAALLARRAAAAADHPRATRLAPLVADVVESFAPLAAARQATIATDLDGGVVADVDGGAIRQILLNLLDNAVKYGPVGQTVTVSARPRRRRGPARRSRTKGPAWVPATPKRSGSRSTGSRLRRPRPAAPASVWRSCVSWPNCTAAARGWSAARRRTLRRRNPRRLDERRPRAAAVA